ncbi:MAG: ABC transporter ATP-binding protein [Caldilineaceae bacterium]|nr:ABC transporter ATP-binding protein [Caldilineaceae bacterium]
MSKPVLRVKDLDVRYYTDAGIVPAADKVTFELKPGERLGVVGESGSGKSTTALGILRMIKPPGRISGGEVWLDDIDLVKLSEEEMRQMRGNQISMVPQGAMNSLNPVMRIEDQIMDSMVDHDLGVSRAVMKEMAVEALRAVDLDPKVGKSFPHELSGGMKQRACIAISIAMNPKVIIADEPTSALDVVTQRQVMQTIRKIQDQIGSAVILIGHDMGLMAQFVDRIAVMYAGRLMELGTVQDIFTDAMHPYTQALISSLPGLENRGVFHSLSGITPSLLELPSGCVFHTRCPQVMDICSQRIPPLREYKRERPVACLLYEEEIQKEKSII